jgi:hypothetical protein
MGSDGCEYVSEERLAKRPRPPPCQILHGGSYHPLRATQASKDEREVSSDKKVPTTTDAIVNIVFEIVADSGFTKNHVYLMLRCLLNRQDEDFRFKNESLQEISPAQISLQRLLMIRLYTSANLSETSLKCLADLLKEALRERNDEKCWKLRGVIASLDEALDFLPSHHSDMPLFRGEKIEIISLRQDMTFCMVWFASFSQSLCEALEFTRQQSCTLFVLRNPKNGKDIAFASDCDYEKEVLYPRNSHFKVLNVFTGVDARKNLPELANSKIEDKLTVIVIAEAPTQVPTL